jgi:hypothetical protein
LAKQQKERDLWEAREKQMLPYIIGGFAVAIAGWGVKSIMEVRRNYRNRQSWEWQPPDEHRRVDLTSSFPPTTPPPESPQT